jgi:hypothetical protein
MLRFVIMAGMCALTAYQRHKAPWTSVHEVAGDKPQRKVHVSAILSQYKTLPTGIQDAHLAEEQIRYGVSERSRARSFYVLGIAPQDLFQWVPLFTPLASRPEYVAPTEPLGWWVTRATFNRLQFFRPDILTGMPEGWIGVSWETGCIFIFTFSRG